MTINPRWPADANPDRAAGYAARFAALAAGGADVHGEATFCAALVEPGVRVLDAGCGTGRVAIRLAELGYVCLGVDNDPPMLAQARAASDQIDWAAARGARVAPQWLLGDLADLTSVVSSADWAPADPADAVGPTSVAGPSEPVGPPEPAGPPDAAGPSEPAGPPDAADPSEPAGRPDAADPSEPAGPPDAAGPSEPAKLSHPGIAVEPAGTFDLVVAAGNVVPLVAPGTEAVVIGQLSAALAPDGILVTGFGLDPAHLPLRQAPFGLDEYDAWCAAAGLTLEQRFATWAGATYDGGGYAVNVHRRGDRFRVRNRPT